MYVRDEGGGVKALVVAATMEFAEGANALVGVSTLVPRPIFGASGFAVSLVTYVLAITTRYFYLADVKAIARIARAYVVILLAHRFFWAAAWLGRNC